MSRPLSAHCGVIGFQKLSQGADRSVDSSQDELHMGASLGESLHQHLWVCPGAGVWAKRPHPTHHALREVDTLC